MTRDEARSALRAPLGEHFGHKIPQGVDDAWIDCWQALGMLKLDEPKNTEDTARDIYHECAVGGMNSRYFIYQIYAAGLKIVKK